MPDHDGNVQDVKTVKATEDHKKCLFNSSQHMKFRTSCNIDQCEEILTCNKAIDHSKQQTEKPLHWDLCHTVSHQGPLHWNHPSCNRSPHNVCVEWENGEMTDEPLFIIAADAPIACAIHAKKKGLLNKPGWKPTSRDQPSNKVASSQRSARQRSVSTS